MLGFNKSFLEMVSALYDASKMLGISAQVSDLLQGFRSLVVELWSVLIVTLAS